MKSKLFYLILILLLTVTQSCYKEEIIFNSESDYFLGLPSILKMNGKECCYDYAENCLYYPIEDSIIFNFSPYIEFQEYSLVSMNGKVLKNKDINILGQIEIETEYELIFKTHNKTNKLLLIFINMPIVQIITPNRISDDPKTLAKIQVNYKEINKPVLQYYIGLEHRGGTAQSFSKKSFGFSLKKSIGIDENFSGSFFNLKTNNDWILDAMWIDKSRLRNKISFELWNKMDGNKHFGIKSELVVLFLNNENQGLYCLSENINPEFLNLNNPGAVLYKATDWANGATIFETYSNSTPMNYFWDGWEQKYPDPKLEIRWDPLKSLRHLIVNESNEIFASQIGSIIDLEIFLDYYLFLNLVMAMDNTGKNTFLVKESDTDRFSLIPWDLDGSLGIYWDGTRIGYTSILTNNLYNRLIKINPGGIEIELKNRWNYLRSNIYSNAELRRMCIDSFVKIKKSGIMKWENKKWGSDINIDLEQEYMLQWVENRVAFLDRYFESFNCKQ